MIITDNIKEQVDLYIKNTLIDTPMTSEITVNEILTHLVECEVIDNEYELYDEHGNFDEEKDRVAQLLVTKYIETQLK